MIKLCATLFLLATIVNSNVISEFENLNSNNDEKSWVFLIAGSKGYNNYRHQADVCHAYQVIHNHGIPDEQIVVMMYDDIAHAVENPTPGIIINHPDGSDVYHGVPKDYTKYDVTPANFINVLIGNANAMQGIGSGKVIASGPKDRIFVYFSDHGGSGLIKFPFSVLWSYDLNNAIKIMYNRKQYAQMVIYIEACQSGSLFDGLLRSDINVYATTAANTEESSYACYYDKKRKTFLGDRYSVSWLEDSDEENTEKETLHHQYKVVKANTMTSHVMQYGNITLSQEIVGLFQGRHESKVVSKQTKQGRNEITKTTIPLRPVNDDVPSPDVPLFVLRHRLSAASTSAERLKLTTLLSKEKEVRRRIQWTTSTIAHHAASGQEHLVLLVTKATPKLTQFQCYKEALDAFDRFCFELDDFEYAYGHLYVFGNLCDAGVPINLITESIRLVCV